MTKKEAIEAIESGKKVCHRLFMPDEYVYKKSEGVYAFETGFEFSPSLFWHDRTSDVWDDGWSVFLE